MSYRGKKSKKNKKDLTDTCQTPNVSPVKTSGKESSKVPIEFSSEINFNENESELTTFVIQARALIWKNWLLFSRKMQVAIFIVMTPLVVGYMLNLIIHFATQLNKTGQVDLPVDQINKVDVCNNGIWFNPNTDQECISVGFSIIGHDKDVKSPRYQRYHELMDIFTERQGLEKGRDV